MIKRDDKYKPVFTTNLKDFEYVRKKAQTYFKFEKDVFIKTITNTSTHLYKVKQKERRSGYRDNISLIQIY